MAIILGIDPGLVKTGWGIIEYQNNRYRFIACGLIKPDTDIDFSERLLFLANKLEEIMYIHKPSIAAIEETFINVNSLSSLKLSHARGALMLTIAKYGIKLNEYSATKIKKAIVGNGRAEKQQIEAMVKILLPTSLAKTNDEADALAVAICHTNHQVNYQR